MWLTEWRTLDEIHWIIPIEHANELLWVVVVLVKRRRYTFYSTTRKKFFLLKSTMYQKHVIMAKTFLWPTTNTFLATTNNVHLECPSPTHNIKFRDLYSEQSNQPFFCCIAPLGQQQQPKNKTTNDNSARGLVQSITSNSSSWGDVVPSNWLSVTARLEETHTDCHWAFIVSRGSGFVLSCGRGTNTRTNVFLIKSRSQ